MNQKAHWTLGQRYSQSHLILDEQTDTAWLYGSHCNLIKPSPGLTIETGYKSIRKHIYLAAIRAGYMVRAAF